MWFSLGVESTRWLDRLARFIPNLYEATLGQAIVSPADLERRNINLVGGDPYAGACDLESAPPGVPQELRAEHHTRESGKTPRSSPPDGDSYNAWPTSELQSNQNCRRDGTRARPRGRRIFPKKDLTGFLARERSEHSFMAAGPDLIEFQNSLTSDRA